MPRIRSIKPQFWTSEQVADCSPYARLLFIGMWNFCDDYGVHPASARRLKMEIFPSDDFCSADIRRMIDELIANGLLEEYEVAGSQYWRVTGWDKHQKTDAKTGTYPMPSGQVGAKIRRKNTDKQESIRRTFGEHSPVEKEKEKEKESHAYASAREAETGEPSGFDDFWQAYPRKVGKGAAQKAFGRAKINGSMSEVLTALESQKRSAQWLRDNGQYIPNPTTWLNQHRWEDGVPGQVESKIDYI